MVKRKVCVVDDGQIKRKRQDVRGGERQPRSYKTVGATKFLQHKALGMARIHLLLAAAAGLVCTALASELANYLPVTDDDYFYDWERDSVPAAGYLPYYRRHDVDPAVHMGRTRLGQGLFKMMAGGRDAELRCDFPTHDIISNIVWERVTDPAGRSFAYHPLFFRDLSQREIYYDGSVSSPAYYMRSTVLQRPEGGSLYLKDVTSNDAGIYRCMASRRVPNSIGKWASAVETIFQDVFFYPDRAYYSNH